MPTCPNCGRSSPMWEATEQDTYMCLECRNEVTLEALLAAGREEDAREEAGEEYFAYLDSQEALCEP